MQADFGESDTDHRPAETRPGAYRYAAAYIRPGHIVQVQEEIGCDPEEEFLYLHLPGRAPILTRNGRRHVWGLKSYWQPHPLAHLGVYTNAPAVEVEVEINEWLSRGGRAARSRAGGRGQDVQAALL